MPDPGRAFRRPLGVLMKPTSSVCNLRCDYCFYLGKSAMYPWRNRPRLTLELLRRFCAQYAELSPVLSFAWQGGEPTLMGLPFFEEAVAIATAAARAHTPAPAVHHQLQTNATLIDDAWAEFLAAHRFLVGVSLDGPPQWHDRHRRDAGGTGSHHRVLRGIESLRRHRVKFNILTVVNHENVGHGRQLLRYLVAQGFGHLQFIPVAEPLADGSLAPYSITPVQYRRFLVDTFEEWLRIGYRSVRIRFFDNLIQMLMGMPSEMCIVAPGCGQYVVLEHNGDLYPCDFFVAPETRLGNVMETTLAEMVSGPAFQRFAAQKLPLGSRCLRCPYRSLCYGECPKYRQLQDPHGGSATYFCAAYRGFYRTVMDDARSIAGEILADFHRLPPRGPQP